MTSTFGDATHLLEGIIPPPPLTLQQALRVKTLVLWSDDDDISSVALSFEASFWKLHGFSLLPSLHPRCSRLVLVLVFVVVVFSQGSLSFCACICLLDTSSL